MTKTDEQIEEVDHFDNKLLVHYPDGKAAVLSGEEIHRSAVDLKMLDENAEDPIEDRAPGS